MNRGVNIVVQVSLHGEIAQQAACSSLNVDKVYDLVDVVHRLETEHPFLKHTKYTVDVNKTHVNRNLMLHTGDKVEIFPIARNRN